MVSRALWYNDLTVRQEVGTLWNAVPRNNLEYRNIVFKCLLCFDLFKTLNWNREGHTDFLSLIEFNRLQLSVISILMKSTSLFLTTTTTYRWCWLRHIQTYFLLCIKDPLLSFISKQVIQHKLSTDSVNDFFQITCTLRVDQYMMNCIAIQCIVLLKFWKSKNSIVLFKFKFLLNCIWIVMVSFYWRPITNIATTINKNKKE